MPSLYFYKHFGLLQKKDKTLEGLQKDFYLPEGAKDMCK